jgi:MinD superfamily P-loop ATPase
MKQVGGTTIAVASGKEGTGKTTVAVALAVTLMRGLPEVQFLDCDVEEPDAALFLKPDIVRQSLVTTALPEVDAAECTGCGQCQSACRYNAIRVISGKAEVYTGLCNGCGVCTALCPSGAIVESEKRIGIVESGHRENIVFYSGTLDIGRTLAAPVIHALKSSARADIPTIIDCAPGMSSAVIAAVKGCDFCVLVAEPTPFGLCDLKLMVEVVKELAVPAGIVLNKDESRRFETEEYASRVGMPVLMRIPFLRDIASLCSRGIPLTEAQPSWDGAFWELYDQVERARWRSRSKSQ